MLFVVFRKDWSRGCQSVLFPIWDMYLHSIKWRCVNGRSNFTNYADGKFQSLKGWLQRSDMELIFRTSGELVVQIKIAKVKSLESASRQNIDNFFQHIFQSMYFFVCKTYIILINCSQTKFVEIIAVLSVFCMRFFAWPIFRLNHLTFRPQKRYKQR